jgi:hypothetical protein
MDVTNPGLVNVADEVEGNPDPNGGTAKSTPRETGVLVSAADEGYPPAANDPPADVFPTPGDVFVTGVVPLYDVGSDVIPPAAEVYVDEQSLGQGGMVPVDPMNPAAGTYFRSPDEFVVVGPTETFQTNRSETDSMPNPAGAGTIRYHLQTTTPPSLTSYPVSLQGRQIVFADDTLTLADQGAARTITNYGGNFVVIDRDDESVSNGGVPALNRPQVGDTFVVYVGRQGSEDVSTTGPAASDVFILPSPPAFVPEPAQSQQDAGDINASTGAQPGQPVISTGEQVSTAITVEVADQCAVVGLPTNVYA